MPRVAEHSVVSRLRNQNCLAVKQCTSQHLSDSVIIVKMLSAGICGTDLAILSGARPDCAEVLGHEGVGVVCYAPDDCSLSKGARVIINPVHRRRPQAVIGHSRDGIFREYFCIDAAEASEGGLLVQCPKECALPDAELALAEPLASVLYSLALLRDQCGATSLLIRGSGTVGVLAARLWSILTGSLAVLVSSSEAHARWLQESTPWPVNVRICCSAGLTSVLRDYEGGPGFNAAILCCSREHAPQGLELLLDVVPEGATIDLMAGFPPEYRTTRLDGVSLDAIRWNNICGTNGSPPTAVVDRSSGKTVQLMGHRGTAERHILQAIKLLSDRVISMADVPHRLLSLEQLPGVVDLMLSANTRQHTKWIKAIVAFTREDSAAQTYDS